MLKFNGKPFNSGEFERAIQKKAAESVIAQVRERYGSIRHPETGEFPTVFAAGDTLDSLQIRIEGSAALLKLVKERFSDGDEKLIVLADSSNRPPRVFLSYSWEDSALAGRIANTFQSSGIDTWWAEWCMGAGDSLRQKIDQGLSDCTHFVVLLTPRSIVRPWVNQEMDAGLVRKLNAQAKFIPLRHELKPGELPPLLAGMVSPEVGQNASNLQQVVNDILGVTKKPPLGSSPAAAIAQVETQTGYSPAANAIAQALVKASKYGTAHDPQMQVETLMDTTGLSFEDVKDACFELSNLVHLHREEVVWPLEALFAEFDKHWMPWDPADDALKLAGDMVNDENFPETSKDIADRYSWLPRRLNAAVSYLIRRGAARETKVLGEPEFVSHWVSKTDATRRFVKSRN